MDPELVRVRLASLLPGVEIVLSGSASVDGLDAADVDLVALVEDVESATRVVRTVFPVLHEDQWRTDWAAFRVAGTPPVDIVLTVRGSRGDAHHRRAWDLLRADATLLDEYRALKHAGCDAERKRMFFERVVERLEP